MDCEPPRVLRAGIILLVLVVLENHGLIQYDTILRHNQVLVCLNPKVNKKGKILATLYNSVSLCVCAARELRTYLHNKDILYQIIRNESEQSKTYASMSSAETETKRAHPVYIILELAVRTPTKIPCQNSKLQQSSYPNPTG